MSKLTPQKKWLLAILAVIIINGLVWYFGLSPSLENVQATNDEISQSEQQITSLEQRLASLNEIDADSLSQEMEGLNLQVPELGLLREFLIYLEEESHELDLILSSIPSLSQNEVEPYKAMNIRVMVSGGYQDVFDFIKVLEQHERLLLVNTFTLTGSEVTVSCNIDLVIYAEDFDKHTPYEAPGRDNPFEGS